MKRRLNESKIEKVCNILEKIIIIMTEAINKIQIYAKFKNNNNKVANFLLIK